MASEKRWRRARRRQGKSGPPERSSLLPICGVRNPEPERQVFKPLSAGDAGPTEEWVLDSFWVRFGLFLGLNFKHFIVRNNLF